MSSRLVDTLILDSKKICGTDYGRKTFKFDMTKHYIKSAENRLDENAMDEIATWLIKKGLRSSTCALPGFFWLLSHVIYLKLTKVL